MLPINQTERKARSQAREAVRTALRSGLIERPTACESNESIHAPGMIEAHHFLGYGRAHWLDIRWLCKRCHRLADSVEYAKIRGEREQQLIEAGLLRSAVR